MTWWYKGILDGTMSLFYLVMIYKILLMTFSWTALIIHYYMFSSCTLAIYYCRVPLSCTKGPLFIVMIGISFLLTHRGLEEMDNVSQTTLFKHIFFNDNVWISINISLKFVPKVPSNNIPALLPIMAWHRPDDKPLSEPMMVILITHICIIRPQWINCSYILVFNP